MVLCTFLGSQWPPLGTYQNLSFYPIFPIFRPPPLAPHRKGNPDFLFFIGHHLGSQVSKKIPKIGVESDPDNDKICIKLRFWDILKKCRVFSVLPPPPVIVRPFFNGFSKFKKQWTPEGLGSLSQEKKLGKKIFFFEKNIFKKKSFFEKCS